MLINPDGSYNEMVGTSPDITLPFAEVPETVTRQALLRDTWIRRIIDEPWLWRLINELGLKSEGAL